jgi:hypothetical protein
MRSPFSFLSQRRHDLLGEALHEFLPLRESVGRYV